MASSPQPPPPRWARLVDFLSLALVVVAVIVAVSGGFRVRVGGFRFALTSAYRTLLWAGALVVVRHVIARGSPIYRDLPALAASGWRTVAARTAVGACVGTRAAILLVGYLAVFTVGYREGGAPWKIDDDNEFLNLQGRWDAGWYMTVAMEGYKYVPNRPLDQQNIVFFPAYPLLMRTLGRLLGGASPAVFALAGTLISLAAFAGGLIYLFRFARDMLGGDEEAAAAVWLLATFPFALFFGAVYTESLFLVGAVGAFYHFRRREWARASAWGLIVGLTRPPGCFLSVPLALVAIEPWLPAWLAGGPVRDPGRPPPLRGLVPAVVAAAMPGVGMLLYSAYIWQLTGDPLAWAKGHAAWGREYGGLGVLITQRYEWLSQGGLYAYTSQVPGDLLNAIGAIFVLVAAWPVARRLGLAYAVFILVSILPPLAAGGLLSAGRFSAVLFPAFVWFASAVPERHRAAWQAGFMAIQALNAVLFYTWRPLF